MALLPVADALARVLDGVEPLPRRDAPLDRRAWPRARRRPRGAAHPAAGRRLGHGRLCGARRRCRERAGDAQASSARSRPASRSPARSAPAKRRASSPAAWCRPAPTPSSSRRTPTRDGDTRRSSTHRRRAAGTSARAGLDFKQGEVLLPRGRRLTDRDLTLAAAMNHPTLPVHRRPKVAVLATGDELVPPGSDARPRRDRLFQRLCADGAGARAKAPR